MRYAITIGFKHGCGTPEVITGPNVPIGDQRAAMREARQLPHHEKFQRIELWDSSQGRIARKRLGQPVEEGADAQGGEESSPKSKTKKTAKK